MKQNKKLLLYFLTTILTLGMLGSFSPTSYANEHHFHDEYEKLDDTKKQQVDEVLSSLKADLEKWGLKVPEHHKGKHEFLEKLDEKTKQQVKEIVIELEKGNLTKEEADQKLTKLGVNVPEKECKVFENLDEEKKSRAKEIFKQMKDGSITEEEGKKQLKELGVEMPKHPMREHFDKLDEEVKTKIKVRVEEAKAQFEELGVPFPKKYDLLTK
ncbi:hypothetical protein [Lysinibacillus sp. BW-2-10]|uniref:hypothetical protein n=1 Tax=Lysinibacillus sp. BW-2-10 TaxID=2590030 RepID=UPI0011806E35|nr:hypothetical protein [Lysinibacillus sp. BW-2-10]TSI08693.1 hypothetical protein FJQ64_07020 [Lysinibacillus sp. BW-2-10]